VEAAFRVTNRKLNLLSSITRHDINNQLMALEGQLALLKIKHFDLSSDEHVLRAETAVKRITAMIQFTKEYENIGVNAPVWHNAWELVERAAKGVALGPVTIVNDVPADIEVMADQLIAKVFHNLIDNAVKHGNGITAIRFSVEQQDGAITIICEDDGCGIPSERKEGLFANGSGRGHGFGLFLSREILAITGITLNENGRHGKGARFEITAPAGAWQIKDNICMRPFSSSNISTQNVLLG
jgi:K+-sensing histidine kinase KdpD